MQALEFITAISSKMLNADNSLRVVSGKLRVDIAGWYRRSTSIERRPCKIRQY